MNYLSYRINKLIYVHLSFFKYFLIKYFYFYFYIFTLSYIKISRYYLF